MSEVTANAPSGVIHDIGYQRYDGPRLGRRYVFGSLYARACVPRSASAAASRRRSSRG